MVIENKDKEHTGVVKWYNNTKGFGVIIEKETQEEIFVHYSKIDENNKNKHIVLEEKEEVKFKLETNDGKVCASCVKPVAENFKNIKLFNDKSNKKNKKTRNTTEFSPSHEAPDMHLVVQDPSSNGHKYTGDITIRDVILIKNMFKKDENIYEKLKNEIDNSGLNMEDLWKSWHGDTHYIADDSLDWKDKCPTFKYILDKIATFFDMQIKATRLNYYSNSNEWKPFHHDAAAVKKDKAKTQNFTVAISFGLARDIAFQHAKHGTIISTTVDDGSLYAFCRDVNVIWKHGVRQMKNEDFKDEGRFSIIAWGWKDMKEV